MSLRHAHVSGQSGFDLEDYVGADYFLRVVQALHAAAKVRGEMSWPLTDMLGDAWPGEDRRFLRFGTPTAAAFDEDVREPVLVVQWPVVFARAGRFTVTGMADPGRVRALAAAAAAAAAAADTATPPAAEGLEPAEGRRRNTVDPARALGRSTSRVEDGSPLGPGGVASAEPRTPRERVRRSRHVDRVTLQLRLSLRVGLMQLHVERATLGTDRDREIEHPVLSSLWPTIRAILRNQLASAFQSQPFGLTAGLSGLRRLNMQFLRRGDGFAPCVAALINVDMDLEGYHAAEEHATQRAVGMLSVLQGRLMFHEIRKEGDGFITLNLPAAEVVASLDRNEVGGLMANRGWTAEIDESDSRGFGLRFLRADGRSVTPNAALSAWTAYRNRTPYDPARGRPEKIENQLLDGEDMRVGLGPAFFARMQHAMRNGLTGGYSDEDEPKIELAGWEGRLRELTLRPHADRIEILLELTFDSSKGDLSFFSVFAEHGFGSKTAELTLQVQVRPKLKAGVLTFNTDLTSVDLRHSFIDARKRAVRMEFTGEQLGRTLVADEEQRELYTALDLAMEEKLRDQIQPFLRQKVAAGFPALDAIQKAEIVVDSGVADSWPLYAVDEVLLHRTASWALDAQGLSFVIEAGTLARKRGRQAQLVRVSRGPGGDDELGEMRGLVLRANVGGSSRQISLRKAKLHRERGWLSQIPIRLTAIQRVFGTPVAARTFKGVVLTCAELLELIEHDIVRVANGVTLEAGDEASSTFYRPPPELTEFEVEL